MLLLLILLLLVTTAPLMTLLFLPVYMVSRSIQSQCRTTLIATRLHMMSYWQNGQL